MIKLDMIKKDSVGYSRIENTVREIKHSMDGFNS